MVSLENPKHIYEKHLCVMFASYKWPSQQQQQQQTNQQILKIIM